mmetsp:Transcript_30873/g.87371  ORF Transcript_30873/g.87371 Transcript_30873/m.87371 type:complete len:111 (+) Transcript_30873:1457-1789(+)
MGRVELSRIQALFKFGNASHQAPDVSFYCPRIGRISQLHHRGSSDRGWSRERGEGRGGEALGPDVVPEAFSQPGLGFGDDVSSVPFSVHVQAPSLPPLCRLVRRSGGDTV